MHIKNIIPMKYVFVIFLGGFLSIILDIWPQYSGAKKCYIMLLFMTSIGIILRIIDWVTATISSQK